MAARRSRKSPQPAPVEQLRRIDQLCDHFEQGWRSGLRPRIEDYLQGAAEHQQRELVRALVAIEVELLNRDGQPPSRAAYKQRFAKDWSALRDLFPKARPDPPGPQTPPAAPVLPPAAGQQGQLEGPRVTLEVVEGPHRGARFAFDRHDTFLAGRSSAAHLRLNDDGHFSRHHFRLEVNPPQCFLIDLGSRNGTFVNRERVQEAFLRDGDVVSGGRTVMRVSISGPAATLPEAAAPPAALAPVPAAPPAPWDMLRQLAQPGEIRPQVSGYELYEELGRGAMGRVYRATHLSTRRDCAVKLLIPAHAAGEKALTLFIREASIHTRLDHPRIVKSYEMGLSEGQLFLAMEYVRNRRYDALIRNASPATRVRVACVIACQMLEALEYAHSRGLVHRDIKPANILLARTGRALHARLADFGLAKQYADAGFSQISRDGDIAGSLPYMSPEQLINSRHAKPPSDLYSLGATLYWYLTGETPHDFANAPCRFRVVLEDPIVPLTDRNRDLPPDLARAVERSLSREPGDRYSSAAEFKQALLRWTRRG